MAKEALSQNEIDALLSQAQAGAEGLLKVTTQREKAVFAYNFRRQKRFNKSHFVLLESIHKRFLRNLEVTLTNLLNTPIMGTIAAATELTFHECLDSIPSPTCLYILNINKGTGKFLLEIDPNFAFFVIDKILGGKGKETTTLNRELSLIEERIMHRMVRLLNADLQEAWQRVESLEVEVEGYYAQPDYVQVVGENESVILVSMDVRSTDKVLGYINLCLPSGILERLLMKYEKHDDGLNRSDEEVLEDRRSLERRIRNSILPVKVVLGSTKMTVADLMSLEPGDVIYLQSRVDKEVDVHVGNLSLFKGVPVKSDNTVAVSISEVVPQLR